MQQRDVAHVCHSKSMPLGRLCHSCPRSDAPREDAHAARALICNHPSLPPQGALAAAAAGETPTVRVSFAERTGGGLFAAVDERGRLAETGWQAFPTLMCAPAHSDRVYSPCALSLCSTCRALHVVQGAARGRACISYLCCLLVAHSPSLGSAAARPARPAAVRAYCQHTGAARGCAQAPELRANLSEPALTVPVFDDAARPCLVQAPTLAVNQPGAVAAPACASKRVSSRNSWHPSGSQTGRELQAIGVLPMQPPMTMGSPLNR